MVTASAITEPRRDSAGVELLKVRSGVVVGVGGYASGVMCCAHFLLTQQKKGGEEEEVEIKGAMTMGQQKEEAGGEE